MEAPKLRLLRKRTKPFCCWTHKGEHDLDVAPLLSQLLHWANNIWTGINRENIFAPPPKKNVQKVISYFINVTLRLQTFPLKHSIVCKKQVLLICGRIITQMDSLPAKMNFIHRSIYWMTPSHHTISNKILQIKTRDWKYDHGYCLRGATVQDLGSLVSITASGTTAVWSFPQLQSYIKPHERFVFSSYLQ